MGRSRARRVATKISGLTKREALSHLSRSALAAQGVMEKKGATERLTAN
jgi:hypothetical protein